MFVGELDLTSETAVAQMARIMYFAVEFWPADARHDLADYFDTFKHDELSVIASITRDFVTPAIAPHLRCERYVA